MKPTSKHTAALAALVLLAGCQAPLSQSQSEALHAEVDALVAEGKLTAIQAAWLHEQIEAQREGGGVDWSALGETLAAIGGAVAAALLGVRITRGPAKPVDKSQVTVLQELIRERVKDHNAGRSGEGHAA